MSSCPGTNLSRDFEDCEFPVDVEVGWEGQSDELGEPVMCCTRPDSVLPIIG
jgi:hypothetical protein